MTYIPAINCTGMGRVERYAGTAMPQMSGCDVAGDCQRGHSAALSLRTSQIHSAQDRWHHDLHGHRQTNRRGSSPKRHKDLPLLFRDWPEIPQSDHDRRSRSYGPIGQQRNGGSLSSPSGQRLDSAGLRETRYCGGIRMASHHRRRRFFQNQVIGESHVSP